MICFSPFFWYCVIFCVVPSSSTKKFSTAKLVIFSICERIQASNLHTHTHTKWMWGRKWLRRQNSCTFNGWTCKHSCVCVRSLVALSVSRAYRFFYLDLFLAQKSATCITLCKGRIRVVLPLLRIFSKHPAANVWYQPRIMLLQTRKTKRGIERDKGKCSNNTFDLHFYCYDESV